MHYRTLGNSGAVVSTYALGTMNRPGFHAAVLLAAPMFIGPFVSA
jgi:aryl-alcohol dehydrogenase-like predicted oxidoreductase